MKKPPFGIRFLLLLLIGCMGVVCCPLTGFAQAPAFAPVTPPDWLHDLTRIGYGFSVSTSEMQDKSAQAGCQISEINFVIPQYVHYPSKYLKQRNPSIAPDAVERDIQEYKRRGVRILAVVPPNLQAEIYATHPDWRYVDSNPPIVPDVDLKQNPVGGRLCLLGPWGEQFIDICVEILTLYPDVDAFSFDGLHHAGICRCEHCRQNYRQETGAEIPIGNLSDPAFRRFLLWQDVRLENLIARLQTRIKAIKPTAALITWSTNAGRFGHLLDVPRNMSSRTNLLFDAPDQEFWMDETNRGNTILPAFANACMWAASNHRIAFSNPYLLSHGNPYNADSFPSYEAIHRTLLALTWGVRPSVALGQPVPLQEAILQSLREVKRRERWIKRVEPERWAALVLSDTTRNFYGDGQVEARYLANVFGMFRAAVESHLNVTVLYDHALNAAEIAKYKVLLLPNTACLSDNQVGAIRAFVQNGGGLVATQDTSLYNEMGEPRTDFALGDLFGIHYRGLPAKGLQTEALDSNFIKGLGADYWAKRTGIYRFIANAPQAVQDPLLRGYLSAGGVTFKGQAVAVEAIDPKSITATFTAAEEIQSSYPAVVQKSFGKGRVVYIATGLDAACYQYAYPYQSRFLAEAIRWSAPLPSPIQIDAPQCVYSAVYRQKDAQGERLVIHLFNNVNTAANHARPEDDVPLREETIPIANVRVHLTGYAIKSVHLEPEGKRLSPHKTKQGTEIIVPALVTHSMVVVELDANARL